MLLFLSIAIPIFLVFNIIAYRQLVRIHPRRRPLIIAVTVVCNLMWLFLPLIRVRTDFARVVRAVLGPPWFAWLCFILVYCAVLFLVFMAWLPYRRRPFAEFARWPSRVFLWGTLVAGVIGVYTALMPLDVERVPIELHNLPLELDGTRIVLMADLHVGLFTRPSRLRKIFDTAHDLNPHLVVLAGDLVDDDPYYLPKLLDGTRALDPSTPLLAVFGNHEMYGAPLEVIERLRGSRIRLLVNEGFPWRAGVPAGRAAAVPGGGVWIAGISDYAAQTDALKPNLAAALAGRQPADFPIVVAHQPKAFPDAIKLGLPLTLCAHSHGGQFGFRRLGWSLAGVFLPYHMGLYRRGESQLYVNTGTGCWLLPWRFGLPPEITLIELRRR